MGELMALITEIGRKYHGSVYDYEAMRSWDAGQAVCREQYGVDWMNSPQFREQEEVCSGDENKIHAGAIEAAERVLAGTPEWMKE